MLTPEVRTARDYNRGSGGPVRWLLAGLLGIAGLAVLIALDGPMARAARWGNGHLWGDTARVLQWLHEYGQGPSVLLVAIIVWQLDPRRRRQLVHWLIGIGITAVLLTTLKLAIGRPRPKFDEPLLFLGPFGAYPLGQDRGVHHAWEFWVPYSWELWSMPSSHAAYAAVMSYFLGSLYPRIRVVVVVLAAVVCVCRVLYGAHYPSDVVVGAAIGVIAGRLAMRSPLRADGAGALADASRPATDSPDAPG